MFNRKKEMQEKKLVCPWNQKNGYACDYTFATRLFNFLTRNYKSMAMAHPMDEEEYEYLVRCAAELKTWQMSVPTSLNHQYFENLKNVKTSDGVKKYLKAIGAIDAYDVEKHLGEKPDKGYPDDINTYDNRGVFVAVNENGDFHLFLRCPQRKQDKHMVEDLSTWEEDHYGKPYHPEKWDGTYVRYWTAWYYGEDKGLYIEPEKLPASVQSMTWEDEPIKLI